MSRNVYFLKRASVGCERLGGGRDMPDQATNTTQKRLRILEEDEIEALYERPHFTDEERLKYFGLSPTEKATLDQFHSIKSRIYFILQLGYFKWSHTCWLRILFRDFPHAA